MARQVAAKAAPRPTSLPPRNGSTRRRGSAVGGRGADAERAPARALRGPRPLFGLPFGWIAAAAAVAVVAGLLYAVFARSAGAGARAGSGAAGAAGAPLATLKTADFHALAFSPDNANVVFFGHHNGIMRSDDAGKTWKPLVDRRNFDAMGLAVSRGGSGPFYLAGHDIFQVSTDGGVTWQPVQHNLPGTDIHGFSMSPSDPDRLYAFVVGQGTFTSGDGAKTWQRLPGQLPDDVMGVTAAGVAAGDSAGNPETLYASSMGSGVLRSADGGQTWTSAMGALGRRGVLSIAADPTSPQTLYAGLDSGLYKTADGGGSWTRLGFPAQNVVTIAVSPVQPQRILAIGIRGRDGVVYRSDDGGQSWGAR